MLSSATQCPSAASSHGKRAQGILQASAAVCVRPVAAPPPRRRQQQQQQQQRGRQQQQQQPAAEQQPWAQLPPQLQDLTVQTAAPKRRRRRPASSRGSPAPRGQWTPLHSKLLQSLRQQQVLPQHARVLIGVSGGQDSMAMLRLLHDLSQQHHWPLRLVVGHCDHRVRPDSGEAAAHVQRFCQSLGLPYKQAVADRQTGHWPEAAARDWRQQQLQRMAAEACCDYLALGHTATERAETVLFNMIRGAGLRGVGAMGWSRPLQDTGLQLVRPLLAFSRPETLQACQLTHTEIYPDSTNTDPRYVRNRMRLSVFPLLQGINSAAVDHICTTAEIARLEGQLVEALADIQLTAAAVHCRLASTADLQQQQDSAYVRLGVCLGQRQQHHQDELSAQPAWAPLEQQQQQQQQDRVQEQTEVLPGASPAGLYVQALRVPALAELHPALQRMVVHLWLSQHTARSVSSRHVGEVLNLLRPGRSTGDKTSTLWGSSCVLRHRQLLVVLNAAKARQVRAGELHVQQPTSRAGSDTLQATAAAAAAAAARVLTEAPVSFRMSFS